MKSWLTRLLWFVKRKPSQQRLMVAATFWLAVSRTAILTLPHARLEKWFGMRFIETGETLTEEQMAEGRKVARAIARVSGHTPWTSNCLPQAMTARRLLRHRDVPTTIYIGAKFHEAEPKLMAHAWCRCGPLFVTGGNGANEYGSIISYGTTP